MEPFFIFGMILVSVVVGADHGKKSGKEEVVSSQVYCERVRAYSDGSIQKRCWRIKKILDDEL